MTGFLLRPIDLSSLNLLFVAILIGWRLTLMRPRTNAIRFLALFFGSIILLVGLWLVAGTRFDSWHDYAVYSWRVVWMLGFVCLIQYAYRVGELDLKRKEARAALAVSLTGAAIVTGWAIFNIWQIAGGSERVARFLLPEAIIFLSLMWALIVTLRQVRRNWRVAKSFALVSHFSGLILGLVLLVLAGVSVVADQLVGGIGVLSLGRVYLVALGITIIGFNDLIYRDSVNSRVNGVILVSLLLLQTVFTFGGLFVTQEFQGDNLGSTPLMEAIDPFAGGDASQLEGRQVLDAWTRPIFGFQAVITLVAILLMMLASSRIKFLDRYFNQFAFSSRQREIISMAAQGLSNQQIAKELFISENTVKYHLRGIYDSIGLSDRKALTVWYRQNLGDEATAG